MHIYKQKGFSIIELMIALLLGLLIIAGILQLFLGITQTYRQNDELARAQENGRIALTFIAKDLRMAGYWESEGADTDTAFFLFDCDSKLKKCDKDKFGLKPGQLSIAYQPPDGMDCAGRSSDITRGDLIVNAYYVAQDPSNNNESSLFCRSYNLTTDTELTPGQVLISGIESLTAQYAIAKSSSGTTEKYLSDAEVQKVDERNVKAVKVTVEASSANNTVQPYSTTVQIKNAL
ncbi:PilW family protein [Spartinivicinus ruber]|uniref:PilW family protein n=1 Tax=Spartinivicinus ruber TaxID=2683272 RepID=UPI0022A6A575|nr:PilW family protein [Spartinivicinus ruber]